MIKLTELVNVTNDVVRLDAVAYGKQLFQELIRGKRITQPSITEDMFLDMFQYSLKLSQLDPLDQVWREEGYKFDELFIPSFMVDVLPLSFVGARPEKGYDNLLLPMEINYSNDFDPHFKSEPDVRRFTALVFNMYKTDCDEVTSLTQANAAQTWGSVDPCFYLDGQFKMKSNDLMKFPAIFDPWLIKMHDRLFFGDAEPIFDRFIYKWANEVHKLQRKPKSNKKDDQTDQSK